MATPEAHGGSGGMTFDAEVVRRLEALYETSDAVRRRRAVREALALRPGDHAIDIGTGPGFLAVELAEAVGRGGHVLGVDRSEPMLARARARCAAHPWVRLESADAAALPADEATFDAAASVQVFEFVADVDRALDEMRRVLKPGGRAVVVATDWDSILWHSQDNARMARVLASFGAHCPHTTLPRTLGPRLRRAGFALDGHAVIAQFSPEFDPDSYAAHILRVIGEFVAGRGAVPADEVEAWAEEQRELARRGAFFFCLNQYLFKAHRQD